MTIHFLRIIHGNQPFLGENEWWSTSFWGWNMVNSHLLYGYRVWSASFLGLYLDMWGSLHYAGIHWDMRPYIFEQFTLQCRISFIQGMSLQNMLKYVVYANVPMHVSVFWSMPIYSQNMLGYVGHAWTSQHKLGHSGYTGIHQDTLGYIVLQWNILQSNPTLHL